MIGGFLSFYGRSFTKTIVYMLQSVEYDAGGYLRWLVSINDFRKVMYRKRLVMTRPAKLLLGFLRLGMLAQVISGLIVAYVAVNDSESFLLFLTAAFLLSAPLVWAYLVIVPLWLGRWLVIMPLEFIKVHKSKHLFADRPAVKIAVTGSYGKTTMKEMLLTVLSEGKKVAATPANKNVSISHARFAQKLKGDEDILIIEFGEGKPGDVKRFSAITKPNIAVITGLAPAHLDKYKTLEAAGQDIFSVADFVGPANTYVNGDSSDLKGYLERPNQVYSHAGIGSWKVKSLKNDLHGLKFDLVNDKQTIKVKSQLIGFHQVGPLAAAAALADHLGLTQSQIESGLAKIKAFEHRMQPYELSGAWIIDDTYNGNIEGVKAGLELLKSLPAKRKTYITPGLVDQGDQTAEIHRKLGRLIKKANPDRVVLIVHSVLPYIKEGLDGYKGELVIENDPLDFYTNLDKFVAAGDLVLMQNDWPDNYN